MGSAGERTAFFLSCLGFRLWVAKKRQAGQQQLDCNGGKPASAEDRFPCGELSVGIRVRRQTTASGQNNRESAVKTCLSAASLFAPFERKSGGKFPQDRQGKCRARKPPGFCTCQLTAAGACRTSSLLQSLLVAPSGETTTIVRNRFGQAAERSFGFPRFSQPASPRQSPCKR